MQTKEANTAVCPECGTRLTGAFSRSLGRCMICLLRVGFDDAEEPDERLFAPVTDRLGTYRIQRRDDGTAWELGRGAMGVTYRAVDTSLQRPVALKLIASEWVKRGAEARERFMREARTAASLRHPNVATVYHFGIREENGQCFCAMELVEGETLETRVRRTGPLDALTTIEIALQISSALATAEKQGLVHRDLKPANLMLVEVPMISGPLSSSNDNAMRHSHPSRKNATRASDLLVKVIDFGVAKALVEKPDAMGLTHGGFVGTPAFASPEQFTDALVDVRSDIYSLGATLWYLLTSKRPFQGATIEQIRASQRSRALPVEQLKAAHVPSCLISLLVSMLASEPAARPSVSALTSQLQNCRAQILDRWKSARRLALAAGVIGIAAAAFALFPRWHNQIVSQSVGPANLPEKSIAVLPFRNLSEDKENAYFADGLQEELLNLLSKVPQLQVAARTSSFSFKDKPIEIPEIARKLHVANVLEGSVRKSGDQLRITAKLIRAAEGYHLWSETYDRKLDDIFRIQDEIAGEVVKQLKVTLLGAAPTVRQTDPKAYALYLQAVQVGWHSTPEAYTQSDALFRQVLEIDPRYAPAWHELARNFINEANDGLLPNSEGYARAREAEEKALSIDPNYAPAHAGLGRIAMVNNDFASAAKHFERALAIDPNDINVLGNSATFLQSLGRLHEALALNEAIVRRDPVNVIALNKLAVAQQCTKQFDAAIASFRSVLSLNPGSGGAHSWMFEAMLLKGDAPAALAEIEQEKSESWRLIGLPMAYHALGRKTESDAALATLIAKDEKWGPYNIAYVYAFRGEADKAFEWLDKAVQYQDPGLSQIVGENLFDNIHSDPRWLPLLRKIGRAPEQLAKIQFKVTLPRQ
jgi:serine/threonine protein kinase/Flp pilus assembly protein TadD